MNLLFTTYQGNLAGSTYSIAYLAEGLAQRGHRVFVAGRENSRLFDLLQNTQVQLVAMPFSSKLDRTTMRMLRDLVFKENIQLINAQSSKDRYLTMFARWLYRLPVKIMHTRRQRPESMGGKLQNKFYVWGTDKIVVISHALKETFIRNGVPADHLHVIHNGTPAEQYAAITEENIRYWQKKLDIQPDDVVIGCVARRKKQEQLIQAMQYLPDHYKVLFAGIEPGSLDALVQKWHIKNPIIYAGKLSHEDTLALYPLMKVNVLPSTMDGFGLALVEAMAMGTPVVATRAGGITDVVQHQENGLLFDDGDVETLAHHLQNLIEHREMAEKYRKTGKKTALEQFTIAKTIDHYEQFFQQLITYGK